MMFSKYLWKPRLYGKESWLGERIIYYSLDFQAATPSAQTFWHCQSLTILALFLIQKYSVGYACQQEFEIQQNEFPFL